MQRFLVRTLNEFGLDRADGRTRSSRPRNGQPVYLRDVATVTQRLQGPRGDHARRRQGSRSSSRSTRKATRTRCSSRTRIRARDRGARASRCPEGTSIKPVYDQSHFIAAAIGEVKSAALIGGLLAILVLYAFLRDARATLITGIAIPIYRTQFRRDSRGACHERGYCDAGAVTPSSIARRRT